jgi:bis(5'-nucleosyl)-tetraphosphatase (symmetrical)
MATYAIGDIQGCFSELQQLLALINFDQQDKLWLCGDLVNRGPQSLEVLRFVKSLGDKVIIVLGNHDLHLLAVSAGNSKYVHKNDTLEPILQAEDREDLLYWLRQQKFLHHDTNLNFTMLHAGLPPQWDLISAQKYAQELTMLLQDELQFSIYMQQLYGDKINKWSHKLTGWDRIRFITHCFTRMRYCNAKGKLDFKRKNAPEPRIISDMQPWYRHTHRKSKELNIIFGHWATHGFYAGHGVYALDTGCLWGGSLTALRLEDRQVFAVPCQGCVNPGEN